MNTGQNSNTIKVLHKAGWCDRPTANSKHATNGQQADLIARLWL